MTDKLVKPVRDNRLDFIRGSAVIFMIVCHSLVFLYQGPSPVIEFLVYWGATVCFTMFLLVFGVLYGMKYAKNSLNVNKELKRALTFFVGYLGMGIWVYFWQQTNSGGVIQFKGVMGLVLTKMMPEYTEFVFAFGVFILFAILLKPLFVRFRWMALWLILFSMLCYIMAMVFYDVSVSEIFNLFAKQHLIGDGELHRFGLFMYLPIFALGIGWGFVQIKRTEIINKLVFMGGFVTLTILVVFKFTGWSTWQRWPPSLFFLLYGLIYPCFTYAVYDRLPKMAHFVTDYVSVIGQSAFFYYVGHLLILFPLQYLLNTPHDSAVWALTMVAILITILGLAKQIITRSRG